jgi:hypothetical protein
MSIDEMIAALQAAKAGKVIQFRIAGSTDEWGEVDDPSWNFDECDYRAKPEPREWWLSVNERGHPMHAWDTVTATESQSQYHRPIHVREVIE